MMLTPNFSLAELTNSDTAARRGINNVPDVGGIAKLRKVCETILEPVRAHFGQPVIVKSGYRSPALNKIIPGSSLTSQHVKCEAVDFEVVGQSNYEVAKWCAANLKFGQLILEFYVRGSPSSGWVHCSLPSESNQGEVLTITRKGGRTVKLFGLVP